MIYLDHNATTPVLPEVILAMQQTWERAFGNPGSRHAAGRKARQVLDDARERIASLVQASPDEVIFTSGGTESINLALRSFARGRTGVAVLPPGEHPATDETVRSLAGQGIEPWRLTLNTAGQLVPSSLDDVPWDRALFGTALLAHNETGVVQELAPLLEACQHAGIPSHVDAVQAVGKIPVAFHDLGCTTMSLAAHKFGGPRGIGALLVRSKARLTSQLTGGHQERELRPGTEPVALAVGMATALEICVRNHEVRSRHCESLRDLLQIGLLQQAGPAIVNGAGAPRLPNTLNIAFPGCQADALLVALDLANICCSLGSACASGSTQPSPILVAMGCPEDVLASSLRLSLGPQNTRDEILQAIDQIARIVTQLRARR